jgi:hypothetical protein
MSGGLLAAAAVVVLALLTVGASNAVGDTYKCMVINDRLNTTYKTGLQSAIDAASPGDTLWVRGACFSPIEITKSLTLTGQAIPGFRYAPTIDAGYNLDGKGVVHVSGSDVEVQINSLTLTGTTSNTVHLVAKGGGIWNEQATVILDNVTISGNYARQGGGIYNDHGTVELTNSTIDGNYLLPHDSSSRFGAGIYTTGGSVTLNASTITNNWGAYYGGGIYAIDATVVANASEIAFNQGPGTYGTFRGGGIYAGCDPWQPNQIGSTVTLTDTTIHDSSVTEAGGAIYAWPSTVTLTGTTELTANHTGVYGGGARVSTLVVGGDTTIHGNSAYGGSSAPGGGGVSVNRLTLSGNAKIYDNSVGIYGEGGGVAGNYVTMSDNAKIYENSVGTYGHGGGIYASYASRLTGCVAGTEGDDGVNVYNTTPDDIYTPFP